MPECSSVPSLQAVTRRVKVASSKKMGKFLKHFTVVGDDYHAWNINYKKWENEEEEEEEEEQPPPTAASGEEGRAVDATAAPASAPKRPLDFRTTLRKLFSSHRFQVGGQSPQLRLTRPGWGPTSATASFIVQTSPEPRPYTRRPYSTGYPGQGPCCPGLNKSQSKSQKSFT